MINMNKKYKYANGDPARILCVDRPDINYPVISMDPNGAIIPHDLNGVCSILDDNISNLIEIQQLQDKDIV